MKTSNGNIRHDTVILRRVSVLFWLDALHQAVKADGNGGANKWGDPENPHVVPNLGDHFFHCGAYRSRYCQDCLNKNQCVCKGSLESIQSTMIRYAVGLRRSERRPSKISALDKP